MHVFCVQYYPIMHCNVSDEAREMYCLCRQEFLPLPIHLSLNFCCLFSLLYSGNPPLLLLPDNVRIRRFNLSSTQYSDYVDNAEHIQALDYLWDPEGLGLSKTLYSFKCDTCGY